MKTLFNILLNDEIDTVDIRIINFSEEKRPADLALYWYQAGLKSSRQQTVSLTGDITDMI